MNRSLFGFPLGRSTRPGPYGMPLNSAERLRSVRQFAAHNASGIPAAGANVKSVWVTMHAGTPHRVSGFTIGIRDVSQSNTDFLFDVAACDPGRDPRDDEIIVSNLQISSSGAFSAFGTTTWVPLPIPAGKRVAVRAQWSNGAGSGNLPTMNFYDGGLGDFLECRRSQSIGQNTADSGGTGVDPGGVANTDGSWTLIGTTQFRVRAATLCIGSQQNNTYGAGIGWDIDVAYGSSQIEVVSDIHCYGDSNVDYKAPSLNFLPSIEIPAGEPVYVRGKCTSTDATDRTFDASLVFYG